MSLSITPQNVEQIIFLNKELRKKLSDFDNLFKQWSIGKISPSLKFLSQKAIIILLEQLTNKHIQILEKHFKKNVIVDRFNSHLVESYTSELDSAENFMNGLNNFKNNVVIHRDEDQLYISFWR